VFLHILSYVSLNSERLREFTKDDVLIKQIKKLKPEERRGIKLGIEAIWALEGDDEAAAEAPPSDDEH
jgi:hypothetical protein